MRSTPEHLMWLTRPSSMLMSLALCAGGICAPGFAAAGPAQGPTWSHDLVMRDCILPAPQAPGEIHAWNWGHPLGDVEGDGYADYFLTSISVPPSGNSNDIRLIWRLRSNPIQAPLTWNLPVSPPASPTGSWRQTILATLGTPDGKSRIAMRYSCPGYSHCLGVWDLSTNQLLFELPYPPPPPGRPQLLVFDLADSAGDVNMDGFDDIFYEGRSDPFGWYVTGVISGKNGSLVWQREFQNYNYFQLTTELSPCGESRDLNGDGTPDVIAAYIDLSFVSHLIALSGVDGSTLWHIQDPLYAYDSYRPGVVGPDASGDGVPEVYSASNGSTISGTPGAIAAFSGADGATLWSTSRADLETEAAPVYGGGTEVYFEPPVWVADGWASSPPLVYATVHLRGNFPPRNEKRAVVCLDASTGAFQRFVELPPDLMPWANEPTQHLDEPYWLENMYLLGDVDGDGFDEVGLTVAAREGQQQYAESYFAILGNRTWAIPIETPAGSSIQAEAFIPSGKGMPYAVLASSAFDPAQGHPVRGWQTDLAPTPALQATTTGRFRGRLDASGSGTITLQVPADPSLVGVTFYTRAAVIDPARPNRIHTLSSLGQTLIK